MRKIAYIVLTLIVIANLVGCGLGDDVVTDTSPTKSVSATPTDTATPTPTKTDEYYTFANEQMIDLSKIFTSIGSNTEGDLKDLKKDIDKLTAVKVKIQKKETPEKYKKFSGDIIKGIEAWEEAYKAVLSKDQKKIEALTLSAKKYIDNACELLNEL